MVLLRGILSLCWIVFVVFWVISAAGTKPTVKSPKGQALYRVLNIASYVLLLGGGWFGRMHGSLTHRALPNSTTLAGVGVVLAICGVLLAVWARVVLGGNWSATVTLKKDHTLVRTGPYAAVRHPIYTAVLMLFLGSALAIGTLGPVLAFPVALVGFLIKAPQEEALMEATFGDDYRNYRSSTKMLIPLVL
jgi:protein-S-isoprenylcysteine O-methyltransferase Ste14